MIYFMNTEQLHGLVQNARWFAGYYVRSKQISADMWRVKTNYPARLFEEAA